MLCEGRIFLNVLLLSQNAHFFSSFSGLYLFVVLVVTFVSESRTLIGLCFLGWGVPFVLVSVYVGLRASAAGEDGQQHE